MKTKFKRKKRTKLKAKSFKSKNIIYLSGSKTKQRCCLWKKCRFSRRQWYLSSGSKSFSLRRNSNSFMPVLYLYWERRSMVLNVKTQEAYLPTNKVTRGVELENLYICYLLSKKFLSINQVIWCKDWSSHHFVVTDDLDGDLSVATGGITAQHHVTEHALALVRESWVALVKCLTNAHSWER